MNVQTHVRPEFTIFATIELQNTGRFTKECTTMQNREQNVQECDATKNYSSNVARLTILRQSQDDINGRGEFVESSE